MQNDFATCVENFKKAEILADELDCNIIRGFIYILKSFQMDIESPDYDRIFQESIDYYNRLPAKGYKGFKSAAMNGCALALCATGRVSEVNPYLYQTLEFARESGEKESLFWGVLMAAWVGGLRGERKRCAECFGSVDQFIESTNYPLIGGTKVQYDLMREKSKLNLGNTDEQVWYAEGRKMKLEEIVVEAMAW
jgi:hypothetical protein